MYKLKYNFLALFQLSISAFSILLLTKTFGVSSCADAFFVVFSIISSLQLVQLMFFEQFMYFYNDLRASDTEAAVNFYGYALTWAALVGVLSLLLGLAVPGFLVSIFAHGLDSERVRWGKYFLTGFLPYLLFYPVLCVNERLLNAERKFSWPYIISSFPMLFMFLAQLAILIFPSLSIILIPAAYSVGAIFGASVGFVLSKNMGITPVVQWRHPQGRAFFRNSVAIRFGHNVHNFLVPLVVNNFLSYMPGGTIACYNYAQRFVSALQSVSAGPSQKILASSISQSVSRQTYDEIRGVSKHYLIISSLMFTGLGIVGFFMLTRVLGIVAPGIPVADVYGIRGLYLALLPWSLVMVVESPYTLTIISFKKSRAFILVNSIFLVAFVLLLFGAKYKFLIYALPLAGTVAQFFNFAAFYFYSNLLLRDKLKYVNG